MVRILSFLLIITAIFTACKKPSKIKYSKDEILNAYVNVWNTGYYAPLDTIVTQDFKLRINPTFMPLKGLIL